MWIILLDHSGSMGEPFSGDAEFAGRSTRSKARTKLEAAVDAILDRLPGRAPNERVAIIGFTSTGHLIDEGEARDYARFRSKLANTRATNGTNIGAALRKAAKYLDENPTERFPTVLLVTDGKSDREEAIAARDELVARIVQLSAILIDPTPAADGLLRELLHNGEIQAVTREQELAESVGDVEGRQRAFAKEVEEVHAELTLAAALTLDARASSEDLCFSAGYAAQLSPNVWTPLLVYLYTSSISEQVAAALQQRAGELFVRPAVAVGQATTSVPRGTELTISPRIPGLRTNPREISITWEEDLHDLVFKIRADESLLNERLLGTIDVSVESVLVGDLPISIIVTDQRRPPAEEPAAVVAEGHLYRSVFASYSRSDEAVVRACAHTYEALGIYVYLDKLELRNRAGDAWKEALRRFISDADIFQLFWSDRSSASENVELEWRHALRCVGAKGERFVRPLVWEDDYPELPAPLSGLQLGFLKLDLWRIAGGEPPDLANQPSVSASEPEAVVLPCFPGGDGSTVRRARSDVAYAVSFLEETTGLRYYPVATLLVDDFVVQSVRRETTVDEPPDAPAPGQALALADLLQALSLELHVRFRSNDLGLDTEQLDDAFGRGRVVSPELYDCVISYCEWIIRRIVRQFPGVAARMVLEKLDESTGRDRLARIVRDLIEMRFAAVASGKRKSFGYTWHSLSESKLRQVSDTLRRAGIGVERSRSTEGQFNLQVDSAMPYARLGLEVIDEIEGAVDRIDSTFANFESPSERLQVLERLVLSGLDLGRGDPLEASANLVSAAMRPSWRSLAEDLVGRGAGGLGASPGPIEAMRGFLECVQRMLQQGANRSGDRIVSVGFSIPMPSWDVCAEAIDVGGVKADPSPSMDGEEAAAVIISAPLARLTTLFADASHALLQRLQCLQRLQGLLGSGAERALAVVVPTYGIFTQAGSASVDDRLRRWGREVGVPPDLTLPGTPRVLLSLNALDRFREMLREKGLAPEHATLYQRSVLVHEHFHAIVACALDPDGRRPPGPQHTDRWQDASPANEALAGWMELHAMRDQAEIRRYIEVHHGMGAYPEWPYAGARALELAYLREGLPAIREWIRRLRDDPAGCRVAFDEFVRASGEA